jgi:transcriptional regulator with XRE-family HTH domain
VPAKNSKLPKRQPAKVVFGVALRKARKELGYSQEHVAFEAGLNRTYITELEAGKRNAGIDNLEALAEVVGKPLWEMLRP